MKYIIRIGDTTTGGGTVISGSTGVKFEGIGVARVNDPVDCPLAGHGRTAIAQGNRAFKDNGIPIAFEGDRCGCGCVLISSMPQASAS